MDNTRQMLKRLITEESSKMDYKELATNYQKTQHSSYFATAFYKLFNLIKQIHGYYSNVLPEDAASISLVLLDKCLLSYNFKNSFTTYFYRSYSNRLKSAANFKRNRFPQKQLCVEDVSIYQHSYDNTEQKFFELQHDISLMDLNVKQLQYIKGLCDGYNKTEIAKEMGVSTFYLNRGTKLRTPEIKELLTN
jgi:hypothetical protein